MNRKTEIGNSVLLHSLSVVALNSQKRKNERKEEGRTERRKMVKRFNT